MCSMKDDRNSAKETRILVVAAQEEVRNILQEAMIMAGYQCVIAANGLEALDQLSENMMLQLVSKV
jgi:CheY-like chemotaxis protein